MKRKRRRKTIITPAPVYGCPGCGDPTTGSRSEENGQEYDCCPCCIERETESRKVHSEPDEDFGPWEERGLLPPCPKCGADGERGDQQLECPECGHEWVPEGVYTNA
jgi:hypothetical protein